MAVFSSLSDRLQDTFDKLRGKGRLTEDDINSAMRDIRMALLEADVNYRVVKGFVSACKQKCMTAEVLDSLTPAQNVVRIVLEQLTGLLGTTEAKLELAQNRTPNVIMLVGLQGSGKTTAAAKLAYLLKKQNHSPLLAACDTHRPAAADQLATLGGEIGVPVYQGGFRVHQGGRRPPERHRDRRHCRPPADRRGDDERGCGHQGGRQARPDSHGG